MSISLKEQYASTPLFGSNASAVEALYEQFLDKPESVPDRSATHDILQYLLLPRVLRVRHSTERHVTVARNGGTKRWHETVARNGDSIPNVNGLG